LARTDWPKSPNDAALALEVIFSVLENEVMPEPTKVCTSQCFHDNQTVTRIRYGMDVVIAAIGHLEDANKRFQEFLSPVLQKNIPTFLRWLRFLAEESRWAHPDKDSPGSYGARIAAETLQDLYKDASDDLRAAFNASFEALDLLLYLWTWREESGKTLTWRYANEGYTCPISTLFPFMATKVPGTTRNLVTVFAGRTYRQNRLFIDSSFARLEEWAALTSVGGFKNLPFYAFEAIAMTQKYEFLEVQTYANAYIRAKFPSRALALSLRFSDLKVPPTFGSVTFPIAVSAKFFPNDPADTPAHLIHKIVPDLIKVGLLDILMNHLLEQPVGTAYPWHPWVGNDHMGHPLQILSSMCVHQPICNAVRGVTATIALSKMARLASDYYDKHWGPFFESFLLYDSIWQRWFLSGCHTRLCDSLNVSW
jgi:hypothetical protein